MKNASGQEIRIAGETVRALFDGKETFVRILFQNSILSLAYLDGDVNDPTHNVVQFEVSEVKK